MGLRAKVRVRVKVRVGVAAPPPTPPKLRWKLAGEEARLVARPRDAWLGFGLG